MRYELETLKGWGWPESLEVITLQAKSGKTLEALKDGDNVYVVFGEDLGANKEWGKFRNVAPSGKIIGTQAQFDGFEKTKVLESLGMSYEQIKGLKGKIGIDIK